MTRLNTFELILVDRPDTGAGNFDIEVNYGSIQGETGNASGGSEVLAAHPRRWATRTASRALPSYDLNSEAPGRYDFEVRSGVVTSGTPEPVSVLLLASGVIGLIAFRRRRA